ncbi:hypothetical protein D3C71_1694900 [compost metagenome]
MRCSDKVDTTRIDDDQLCPLPQPFLKPRAEDRMAIGRVGANDDDHIGLLDTVEILRAGRSAERLSEAVAGWRMAHAGAGVDIVVAETCAHQFLDEKGFLICTA